MYSGSVIRAVRKGLGPIFRSGQFRSIEVATLEKRQRHFENPRLTSLEFKFLPTFRRRATRPELCLAFSKFGLLSDNNPSPTSGTRDARARNAISHFKIIGRFASWTPSFWRSIPGSILSRPQFFCIRLILCLMCGRYRLARKKEILAETFDVENDVDWIPRYNVAPGQNVAVVRQDATRPVRSFSLMRWGLIPFWAKDANVGYKMINARAETLTEKPAFREPLQSRRCLIPADGFYEWSKKDKEKSPYCFALGDDSIFAFAGIWARWKNPKGESVETCSIITTSPNSLLADIHGRMPVILERDSYDIWLDPGLKRADDLLGLLKPYRSDTMRRYRVSSRVNHVKNEDPECAAEYKPTTLFG